MKSKLLFLALFILTVIITKAQPTIEWQKSLGGIIEDRANSIKQTSDGGYIVAGFSYSNDGDVTGNHGGDDYWIVKLNSAGGIEWQKSLGGTISDKAESIQQTNDGGYIVAGTSDSDDGDVTGHHGTTDYYDSWIVKLDSAGGIEWQKSLGGTNDDFANSIQQTTDGGYIVAGYSKSIDGDVTGHHGTTYSSDYWIVKLDSAGAIEWQKSLGGTDDDYAESIQQTTDGGYIVAGDSYSNNGDVTGNHGFSDYWIVKLNSTGNIEWQKSLGGIIEDRANSIKQTTDGGYIVAGWSKSNDGDVTGNHGLWDYWIVKLDSAGGIEWQKSLGGTGDDWANSILQTKDGGYIFAGSSRSNDGDVTGNHGFKDYWIVKLDSIGSIEWQKSFGGTDVDEAYSIQQTKDGSYIIAGDSWSNNGDVTVHHGFMDYWIVKLSPYVVGVKEPLANDNSIVLSPNPAGIELSIRSSSFSNEAVTVSVMNMPGEIIHKENINWKGEANINIESLPAGIYFLQLKSEKGNEVKKFVKN